MLLGSYICSCKSSILTCKDYVQISSGRLARLLDKDHMVKVFNNLSEETTNFNYQKGLKLSRSAEADPPSILKALFMIHLFLLDSGTLFLERTASCMYIVGWIATYYVIRGNLVIN